MVRADRFVQELIVPLLDKFEGESVQTAPTIIAIVSHGIFLRQLVKAFLNLEGGASGQGAALALNAGTTSGYALSNTGYGVISLSLATTEQHEVIDVDALEEPHSVVVPPRVERQRVKVSVAVLEWNSKEHLSGVVSDISSTPGVFITHSSTFKRTDTPEGRYRQHGSRSWSERYPDFFL